MTDRDTLPNRVVRLLGAVVASLRTLGDRWYATPALTVGAFALLAVLPQALDVRVFGVGLASVLSLQALILALLWATAAQSWNLVSGFAGQFSLGHAAFFGLGAYTPLVLAREFGVSPWLGMLAGGVVAVGYALCLGGLTFRYDIRGSYFVLVTLAFAELLLYLFVNVDAVGGASGVVKPLPDAYGAEFGLAAFQFTGRLPYYYVVLSFLAVVTLVALLLERSQTGLYLHAIRDDEDAARAVGIPTVRYKLFALALSAFFTAWAGAFWAMYFPSIRPRVVFGVLVNIDIVLPAAVGGIGTVAGPVVGAFALEIISGLGRQAVDFPELQDIVGGVVLLLVVLKSPGGLVSLPGKAADLVDRVNGERKSVWGRDPSRTEDD